MEAHGSRGEGEARSSTFEDARGEGVLGNQSIEAARGNYFHEEVFKPADQAAGYRTGELSPGNRPDAWNANEIREYKPYHEGIDPIRENQAVIDRYNQAFYQTYGYNPTVFRLILYRVV
jgi:hypothetical protein